MLKNGQTYFKNFVVLTFGFLMFSGGSKGNIKTKRLKRFSLHCSGILSSMSYRGPLNLGDLPDRECARTSFVYMKPDRIQHRRI